MTEEIPKIIKPTSSILDETRAAIEDLKREREEISKIRDELQDLRSNQLLSGSAGIRPEMPEAKEETAKEYSERVMNNKVGKVGEH